MWAMICISFLFAYGIWKLVAFLFNYSILRHQINKCCPGPPDLFLIGNSNIFERGGSAFHKQIQGYSDLYKDHPVFRVWLGPFPMFICHRPESVEMVLASTRHINKAFFYGFLNTWMGTGLLTASGEKWRMRRKMLTPAFHFGILSNFIPIFNDTSANLEKKLEAYADTNKEVDVFPLFTLTTLDIICETAMGRKVGALEDPNSPYVKAILELSTTLMERFKKPWLYPEFAFKYLSQSGAEFYRSLKIAQDFSSRVIAETKEQFLLRKGNEDVTNDAGKKKRLAFLDLLLEYQHNGAQLTDQDIREEVDTFMFEGHDTTAAATTWTIYLLGRNPEEQAKIHTEIDEVFQDDHERDVTVEDLNRLTRLDCAIKESMRLFPSVPYIARNIEEDMNVYGVHMARGTSVMVLIMGLHRLADVFPDPGEFRPERFQADEVGDRSPFAHVPFSAGQRNCIGAKFAALEEKIILARLLRRYRFESVQTEEETMPASELILRPANGVKVKVTRRG